MRKKRLFKYYILYLLIYIILYVQFNFNYDSLTGFLKSNILIFNKSILIQIEFFSFCIIMFLLINEYMSFYDKDHPEDDTYTMERVLVIRWKSWSEQNEKKNAKQ